MVEVLWADLLKDWFASFDLTDVYLVPLMILMIGMFTGIIINIIVYMILIKSQPTRELIVCALAFLLTFVTIIIISFASIEMQYAEIFKDVSAIEKLVLFPHYIVFFAIYILASPVLFWDISTLIFGIWMVILMRSFIEVEVKQRKKVNPIFERLI